MSERKGSFSLSFLSLADLAKEGEKFRNGRVSVIPTERSPFDWELAVGEESNAVGEPQSGIDEE